ncbi:MAG: hypothetical protein ACOYUZ_03780 [Patescibacteria group bacterium]
MIELDDYLNIGYKGIVFLECENWERQSGYNEEYTRQTFIAYDKDQAPLKVRVLWVEHPFKFKEYTVEACDPITQIEYKAICLEHGGIADNEGYQARKKKMDIEAKRAEAALKGLIPTCPDCGTNMIPKQNSYTSKYFWGCAHFPRCRGSRNMRKGTYEKYLDLSKKATRR